MEIHGQLKSENEIFFYEHGHALREYLPVQGNPVSSPILRSERGEL
jgi:hypothetical protein